MENRYNKPIKGAAADLPDFDTLIKGTAEDLPDFDEISGQKKSRPLPGEFRNTSSVFDSSDILSPSKLGMPSVLTNQGLIQEVKKKKNFATDEEAIAYAETANRTQTTKDRYTPDLKEFDVSDPDALMNQPIEKIRDWYNSKKKEILDAPLGMATLENINPKTGQPLVTKQIDTDEVGRRNDKLNKLEEIKQNLFAQKFADLDDPKKIGFEYMKIFEPEKLRMVLKTVGVSPSTMEVDGMSANILSKVPQETLNEYLPQSLVFQAEEKGFDVKMTKQADRIQEMLPSIKAKKEASKNRVNKYRDLANSSTDETTINKYRELIAKEEQSIAGDPETAELTTLTTQLTHAARERVLLPAKYPEIANAMAKKDVIEKRYNDSDWFSRQILGDTTPGVMLGEHGAYGLLGGLQKGFFGLSKGLATTLSTSLGVLGIIPEEQAYLANVSMQDDFDRDFYTPEGARSEVPEYAVSPELQEMAKQVGLDPASLSSFAKPQGSKFNWGGMTTTMGEVTGQIIGQAVIGRGVSGAFTKAVGAGSKLHLYGTKAADALRSASIAQDKVGLFASTLATTYGDNYTSGINAGLSENEAHSYGFASSVGSALTELINPDTKITRQILGGASGNRTIREMANVLTDASQKPTARIVNFIKEYGKHAFKNIGSETIEEVADQAKLHILDAGYQIDTTNMPFMEDAIATARTTAIGMIPMAVVGGFGASNRLRREALYEAGTNVRAFKDYVQAQVDKVTDPSAKTAAQEKANQVINVANTMNDIISKLPKTNSRGREFSEDEKQKLAETIFKARKLNNDAGQVTDEVLAEPIRQQAAAAQAEARTIIEGNEPAYIINGQSFGKEKFIEFVNSDQFKNDKSKYEVAVHNDQDALAMVEKITKPVPQPAQPVTSEQVAVGQDQQKADAGISDQEILDAEISAHTKRLSDPAIHEWQKQQSQEFLSDPAAYHAKAIARSQDYLNGHPGDPLAISVINESRASLERINRINAKKQAESVTETPVSVKPAAPDLFSAPPENVKGAVETAPISTSATASESAAENKQVPNISKGAPIKTELAPAEQIESDKVAPVIKDRFNAATKVVNPDVVTNVLPDGTEVSGRYVLYPAGAVTASHNPKSFSSSEGYPLLESGKNPNDNDYSLPKNKAAVVDFANKYDGRAVQEMPTITPDGVVIDGNNRTMSGQLAAEQKTDEAYLKALRQRLKQYGFTEEDFAAVAAEGSPRLGFVTESIPPYTTNTFASFNKNAKKEKSPLAKAIELSRTVDPKVIALLANQMDEHENMSEFYNSSSLARVMDALLKNNVVLPTEEARYYNREKNAITAAGKEFLESLMLGSVVGEDQLTMLTQDGLLRYRQKIVKAIKLFTQVNALGPDFSLRDVLNNVINLKNELVKRKMELDDFIIQENMFETTAPTAEDIILYHNMEGVEKALKDFLQRYFDRARMGNSVSMFATEPESKDAILLDLSRKLNEQQQKSVRQAAARPDRSKQPGSEKSGTEDTGKPATETTGEPRPADTGRRSSQNVTEEQQSNAISEPVGEEQKEEKVDPRIADIEKRRAEELAKGDFTLKELFTIGNKIMIGGKEYTIKASGTKRMKFEDEDGFPPSGRLIPPVIDIDALDVPENARTIDFLRYENGYLDEGDRAKVNAKYDALIAAIKKPTKEQKAEKKYMEEGRKEADYMEFINKPAREPYKEGQEISIMSGSNRLTGVYTVVPGFEDMDFIMTQDGMNFSMYEVATGRPVTNTASFTREGAIEEAIAYLQSNNVTGKKFYDSIRRKKETLNYSGNVSQLADSPAYMRYAEQAEAEYNALPDLYTDEEKVRIRDIAAQARAAGVKNIEDLANKMLDQKDTGDRLLQKSNLDVFQQTLERNIKEKRIQEKKNNKEPLDFLDRDTFIDDEDSFLDWLNQDDKRENRRADFPPELLQRIYNGWRKLQEIANKYGYRPNIQKTDELYFPVVRYSMMARVGKKSEREIEEAKMEKSLNDIDAVYAKEFPGKTKAEVKLKPAKAKAAKAKPTGPAAVPGSLKVEDVKVRRGKSEFRPMGTAGLSEERRMDEVVDKAGNIIGYTESITSIGGTMGASTPKPDGYNAYDADQVLIEKYLDRRQDAVKEVVDNFNTPQDATQNRETLQDELLQEQSDQSQYPRPDQREPESQQAAATETNNSNSDQSGQGEETLTPAQQEFAEMLRTSPLRNKGLAWYSVDAELEEGLIDSIATMIADQASDPNSYEETRKAFGDAIIARALELKGMPPIATATETPATPVATAPTATKALDLITDQEEYERKLTDLQGFFQAQQIKPPPPPQVERSYKRVVTITELDEEEYGPDAFMEANELRTQLYEDGPVTLQRLITNFRRYINRKRINMPAIEALDKMVNEGFITAEAGQLATSLIMDNPALFKDVVIEMASTLDEFQNPGTQGAYDPAKKLVRIFSTNDTVTPLHELLHHTERYLPAASRQGILKEWYDQATQHIETSNQIKGRINAQIKALLDNNQTVPKTMLDDKRNIENIITYLELALKRQTLSSEFEKLKVFNSMMNLPISDGWYQFATPGEFWAVNASRIYQEKKAENVGWLEQAANWLRKFMDNVRAVFNGTEQNKNFATSVTDGLNQILRGQHLDHMDGEMLSGTQNFKLDPAYIQTNINVAEQAVQRFIPLGIITFDDQVAWLATRGHVQMLPFLAQAYRNIRDNPSLFQPGNRVQQLMSTDLDINMRSSSLIANTPADVQIIGNLYTGRVQGNTQLIDEAEEEISMLPISRDKRTKILDYFHKQIEGMQPAPYNVRPQVAQSTIQKALTKAEKIRKKLFAVGGGIDRGVRILKEMEMGNMNEWVSKIRHIQSDFNEAVKAAYPKAALTSPIRSLMDQALRGDPAATFQLAVPVQQAIGRMRTMIDSLTRELVRQGVIPDLVVAQGDLDAARLNNSPGDVIRALEFKVDMARTVHNRVGTYINRQYERNHNKNWSDKIRADDKTIQAAKNFIHSRAKLQLGKDLSEIEVASIIDALASDGDIGAIMKTSNLAMDMSILKHMQDIPVQIRDLMGEIKDTEWNYVNTTIKMASLLERHRFLDGVWQTTQGTIFGASPDPALGFTVEVNNKRWGALNGKYTSQEMIDALKEWDNEAIDNSMFMNLLRQSVSYAKAAKTSLSWVSEIRNLIGNGVALFQNGNFGSPTEFRKGLLAIQDIFGKVKDPANRDFVDRMAKLNIIGNSLALHEIVALTKDLHDIVPAGSSWKPSHMSKIGKWLSDKKNKLGEIYGSTDDIFKIVTFLSERSKLEGAYSRSGVTKTPDEIDREAADITIQVMPTFFKVPGFTKWVSRNIPLMGKLLMSYPVELLRTTYNSVALGVRQTKDSNPEIRKLGAKRLAWFFGTQLGTSMFPLLTGMVASMLGRGVDDEDKEGIYAMLPKFYKNEAVNLVRGKEGVVYVHMMNGLDGQSWFKSIMHAAVRGEGTDVVAEPLVQFLSPFVGANLVVSKYNEWVANEDAFGRPLYNDQDSRMNKAQAFGAHWGSLFTPQTIVDVNKMAKGLYKGEETGPLQVLKLTTGQTVYALDTKKSIKRQLDSYKFDLREAGSIKNKEDKKAAMDRIKLERSEFLRKVKPLKD